MALPKRKLTKSRRNKRRANWRLSVPTLTECPQCHKPKLPHYACKACGYYNGKLVLQLKKKKKKKE